MTGALQRRLDVVGNVFRFGETDILIYAGLFGPIVFRNPGLELDDANIQQHRLVNGRFGHHQFRLFGNHQFLHGTAGSADKDHHEYSNNSKHTASESY